VPRHLPRKNSDFDLRLIQPTSALDLAEAHGERGAALEVAEAVDAWTRDVLVAQSGGVPDLRELADKAREIADRIPPRALLRQRSSAPA